MTFLRNFWNDEQGQDLIEYTLLMAFVALASAALFLGAGGSIKGIWPTTNSQLAAANASTSAARLPGDAPGVTAGSNRSGASVRNCRFRKPTDRSDEPGRFTNDSRNACGRNRTTARCGQRTAAPAHSRKERPETDSGALELTGNRL